MDEPAVQALIAAAIATALADQADALAAAQQAAAAAAAAAAGQPAAPAFALTPGVLNEAAPWDYSTTAGMKLFFASTKGLDPKFKGAQTGLKVFLRALSIKAQNFGWDAMILSIPDSLPTPVNRNLLTHYGLLSIENVQARAATWVGQNSRAAQASKQLAQCITESLEDAVTLKLLVRASEYTVNGVEDGPCMLKTLISVVNIQTRATVSCVRSALKRLPELMNELDSDITVFNGVVSEHIDKLNAMGASCEDLLNHLFEAYQSTSDNALNEYMKDKENKWEDHTIEEMTPETLMTLAEEKFKTLAQKKMHRAPLMTPGKEDSSIIALQAKVKEMLALQADMPGQHDGTKKKKSGKSRDTGEWAWKTVAPTGNQSKEKTFKGKEYLYCPNHGETKWVLKINHADGCRNAPAGNVKAATPPATGGTRGTMASPSKKQLQYAAAFVAAMEEVESEPEDENI
jgi:hypothetical protein